MKKNPQTAYFPLLRIASLVALLFSSVCSPVQANVQPVLPIDTAWLYALTMPLLSTNDLPNPTDIGQFALVDTSKCKKYKTQQRTVITSSTRGQLSDTGWQDFGETPLDCNSDMPTDGQTCSTQTIPGGSLGDRDETITTCISYRYTCIEKCGECKASDVTQTFSVQLPKWSPLKDALAKAAESMPMISKFSIDVAGAVSKETGEKCCLEDESQPPVSYSKWSGTVSAGISVTLNIPGWKWSFVQNWQGLFQISAKIVLGPTVTLSPSGSISVAGLEYTTCAPKCQCCVTTGFKAVIGVKVSFGGEIEANVQLEFWPNSNFTVKAYAKLELGSSISSSGTYNWGGCSGFSGKVSYGDLVGSAQVGLKFKGYTISYIWSITFLPGGSVSF